MNSRSNSEKATFADAIENLEKRGIMPLRVPSLEPTKEALRCLGLRFPEDGRRVIIVAGTNGKGSTSKTLEALLCSAGQRTGLYTSPHLVSYRERIRLAGEDLSEELFVQAWQVVADKTSHLFLSHFEMLTVMAAWVFFSGEVVPVVDYAVFEVGLGGTWDATNAIPHETCVICKLGFDHQEFLGDSLVEIASNKFGVIGDGAKVMHLPLPEEVETLRAEVQSRTNSRWSESPPSALSIDTSERLPRFFLESKWGRAEMSLPGRRGAENMNLALHVFAEIGFDPKAHLSALKNVIWPARMQPVAMPDCPCPVFLSGDHNEQGVESLLELLAHYRYRHLHMVIGVGAKKDLDSMMARLASLPRSSYFFTTAQFRGRQREQYGSWLDRSQGFFEDPMWALEEIGRRAHADDLCLVTGSLYLAGDVLTALLKRKGPPSR